MKERPEANLRQERSLPPFIKVRQTIEKFGIDPRRLKDSSCRKVVTECAVCGSVRIKGFRYAMMQRTCLRCSNGINARRASGRQSRSDLMKLKLKVGLCTPPMLGKKHAPEVLKKMSGVLNPQYGKPPVHAKHVWHTKEDGTRVCFRSAWEAAFARQLDSEGMDWLYEPRAFPVTFRLGGELIDGTYRPDFYSNGRWYEVKGWWHEKAAAKVGAFLRQYPDESWVLVDRIAMQEMGILSSTRRLLK